MYLLDLLNVRYVFTKRKTDRRKRKEIESARAFKKKEGLIGMH